MVLRLAWDLMVMRYGAWTMDMYNGFSCLSFKFGWAPEIGGLGLNGLEGSNEDWVGWKGSLVDREASMLDCIICITTNEKEDYLITHSSLF